METKKSLYLVIGFSRSNWVNGLIVYLSNRLIDLTINRFNYL